MYYCLVLSLIHFICTSIIRLMILAWFWSRVSISLCVNVFPWCFGMKAPEIEMEWTVFKNRIRLLFATLNMLMWVSIFLSILRSRMTTAINESAGADILSPTVIERGCGCHFWRRSRTYSRIVGLSIAPLSTLKKCLATLLT